MPKPFSASEKERINQLLLEEGRRLFSTFGLKKTRVEDLAEAAGISKAAFYLFYESKESLFFEVIEQAESDFRRVVLTEVERPGPTPRARLVHVLRTAFTLWKTIPVLQFFTSAEYVQLTRRLPPEQVQAHLSSDQDFMHSLIEHCRKNGILILVDQAQMAGMMYALLFSVLHANDFGPGLLDPAIEALIEMTAAYLLGEITISGA
jgi:AcrR family transcriptional regulator